MTVTAKTCIRQDDNNSNAVVGKIYTGSVSIIGDGKMVGVERHPVDVQR